MLLPTNFCFLALCLFKVSQTAPVGKILHCLIQLLIVDVHVYMKIFFIESRVTTFKCIGDVHFERIEDKLRNRYWFYIRIQFLTDKSQKIAHERNVQSVSRFLSTRICSAHLQKWNEKWKEYTFNYIRIANHLFNHFCKWAQQFCPNAKSHSNSCCPIDEIYVWGIFRQFFSYMTSFIWTLELWKDFEVVWRFVY